MASKKAVKKGGSASPDDMVETEAASASEAVGKDVNGEDLERHDMQPVPEISNTETTMGELDKVRNILFGEQIRMYEARIQQMENGLKSDISALSSALKDQLQAMDDRFKRQFDEVFELISKETHSREHQGEGIARDLHQLTETFEDFKIDQGKKLEALDSSLLATIDNQTHNLETELRDKMEAMSAELKASLDRLQVSAVNREQFADLLAGLARQIAPSGDGE